MSITADKKNIIKSFIAIIVVLGLLNFLYMFMLSHKSTQLKDIDTQLAGLCIKEQQAGAPYNAVYSICKTYDMLPKDACEMILAAGEDNAFLEGKWPTRSNIEKTLIAAGEAYMAENADKEKAKEATELCYSLKKLDSVISGAFPIDMTVKYEYSDTFGAERTYGGERTHEGIDIICKTGTPIYSLASGVVIKKGWNTLGGWRLLIKDEYGLEYYYAHLSAYVADVEEGDSVLRGQLIGYSGDSGYGEVGTSGQFIAHLHFGIYENGIAINPYFYISQCEKNKY